MWLHLWKLAMNLFQNEILWICGDSKDIQGLGRNTVVNHEDPGIKKQTNKQTNKQENTGALCAPFA